MLLPDPPVRQPLVTHNAVDGSRCPSRPDHRLGPGARHVRGALLVGSAARRQFPADAYSDLDIVLLVRDPRSWLDDAGWVAEIGRAVAHLLWRRPRCATGWNVASEAGPLPVIFVKRHQAADASPPKEGRSPSQDGGLRRRARRFS